MASEWIKIPRIVDGHRYEVNDRGGVWKKGQALRKGPLEYVRVAADGTDQSVAYRSMIKVAGKHVAACVGLFDKLLQIAAKQPAERRWLIFLSGNSRDSWDSGILAQQLSFSQKDVDKALEVLSHEDVRWIEWGEWSPSSREFRGFREIQDKCAPDCLIDTRKTVSDSAADGDTPPLGVVYPAGMDTPAVRQAIVDWLAYRRTLGKPYKSPADQIRRLLKKPELTGPAAFVAAVDHSIANGFQGCYPPSRKGPDAKPAADPDRRPMNDPNEN